MVRFVSISHEEPRPLGVIPDPESVASWDAEFADPSLIAVNDYWKDPLLTDLTHRQRAVTILTAPQEPKLSFAYPVRKPLGAFLELSEDINGESTQELAKRLAGRPELAEELSLGIMYWLHEQRRELPGPSVEQRYDYVSYQSAIDQLLPLVSEVTASELEKWYDPTYFTIKLMDD